MQTNFSVHGQHSGVRSATDELFNFLSCKFTSAYRALAERRHGLLLTRHSTQI